MKLLSFITLCLSFCTLSAFAKAKEGRYSSIKYKSKRINNKFKLSNMKDFIVFGDSYTTTNVDYETMKSPGELYTSAYGPNWVYYMEDKANVTAYNFAYGGATVAYEISPAYLTTVLSFTDQVRKYFNPMMTDGKFKDWDPKKTLFGVWMGINDIGNRKKGTDLSNDDLEDITLLVYFRLMEELYGYGARNFLLLNVPSIENSPWHTTIYPNPDIKYQVESFNELLAEYARDFYKEHQDINLFIYDAHSEFLYVEENYKKFGITTITETCSDLNNPDETCLPKEQYYWGNGLHPTFVVHEALTTDLCKFLSKV